VTPGNSFAPGVGAEIRVRHRIAEFSASFRSFRKRSANQRYRFPIWFSAITK
jgi:hypothetical protein